MKKFAATILALLYLATSTGATVHLHYCMGKLFSWSLVDKDGKNCGRCGMPKNGNNNRSLTFKGTCCQDKYAHLQVDKDQKATENNYTFFAPTVASLWVTTPILSGQHVDAYIMGYPTTNAPPDKVPLFLRHRTFRI